MIFVHNSSSRHSKYINNKYIVLGEVPTDDIDDNAGDSEKTLILVLLNQKQVLFNLAL